MNFPGDVGRRAPYTHSYLGGRRSRGRDYHISRRTRHELQAHHGHVALLNRPRAGPALVCECECVNVNVCHCVISDTQLQEGFLDGAGGAFSEAFSGFPYSSVRLLVPPSRLFHDHSSGFWWAPHGRLRPSWAERKEPSPRRCPHPVRHASIALG